MKLDKRQRAERDAAQHAYTLARDKFNAELTAYDAELHATILAANERLRKAYDRLHVEAVALEAARVSLDETIRAIGDDLKDTLDDRSERWQDSAAGQDAAMWVDEYVGYETLEWEGAQLPDVSYSTWWKVEPAADIVLPAVSSEE